MAATVPAMETVLYACVALVTVAVLALVAVVFSLVGAVGSMADRVFAERTDAGRIDALGRLRGKRTAVPAQEPQADDARAATPPPLYGEQFGKDFDGAA